MMGFTRIYIAVLRVLYDMLNLYSSHCVAQFSLSITKKSIACLRLQFDVPYPCHDSVAMDDTPALV
jgi:hypothetical protein